MPTGIDPKSSAAAENVSADGGASPRSDTNSSDVAESDAISSAAICRPDACGTKPTEKVQLAPGTTVAQVVCIAKSLVVNADATWMVAVPVLSRVIVWAGDTLPTAVCGKLSAVLAKPGLQLHYDSPDIREIIVSGDIAVVRLFWTLTAQKGGASSVSTEAGMDIFKRQPDGKWSIARFISFSATPNKVLE